MPFEERVRIVSALKCVDVVVSQCAYSPVDNLKAIKPDIFFESTSHGEKAIQYHRDIMKTLEGKMIVIPYYPTQSSSNFYFLRVNFSVAIPGIIEQYGLTKTVLGGAASAFFAMYAVGQFLSGQMADNIGPKRMIAFGLIFSILVSLIIPSFAGIIVLVTVLWGLNGIFQSMGWAPSVRIVSAWF